MTLNPGDKVRVLRGAFAGEICTVRDATQDEVWLIEMPKSQSMSTKILERLSPMDLAEGSD